MDRNDDFHVLSAVTINIAFMIIAFLNDNPSIILSALVWSLSLLWVYGEKQKIKKGFIYFIPIAMVTAIINIIFVNSGSHQLFTIFNKQVTLESIVYSIIMCLKILIIIYVFMGFSSMLDSDKAVSYFSSKMPKSTLTMLITFKLIPNMKNRVKDLEDIYSLRGVDYQSKGLKSKIKSRIPVLSILLEDSLESSFHIAEAAYVKGFLSGKRSIYDEQKLKIKDVFIIIYSIGIIVLFSIFKNKGFMNFEIYDSLNLKYIFSNQSMIICGLMLFITLFICLYIIFTNFRKDK